MATQITKHPQDCLAPFWGPDGQRIFYQAVAGPGPDIGGTAFNLWSVGAAGGTPELVLKWVWHAAISPDGKTLAVARSASPGGLGEVWLATPPGGELKKYNRAPFGGKRYLSYVHLQFAPDGSKLGASIFSTESVPEFWVLPLGAGEPRRALSSFPRTYGHPKFSWMPDSRRLVFSETFYSNANPHLLMADTERNIVRPITAGAESEQSPAVSPSGGMIAYASMEGAYDIVEVPIDGSGIHTLMSTARNEVTPGWSPAGGVFAYATDRNGEPEIWLKSRTEGWDRPLVTQKDFGSDRTSSILDVTFAPDGQRIAYRRFGDKEEAVWVSTLVHRQYNNETYIIRHEANRPGTVGG